MTAVDIRSAADVEERIIRLSDVLEEETERYADLAEQRAEAESDYKYRHSRALVEQAGKIPVATKDAVAHLRASDDYRRWKILEAREKATQQKLIAARSQLDALRTVAANVRAATR